VIRALRALLCFALVCCAPTLSSLPPSSPVFALTRDGLPVCSAFAVSPTELLTSAHCVDSEGDFGVVSREVWRKTSDATKEVQIVELDEDRDIARLRIDVPLEVFFTTRKPRVGEPVTAIGAAFDWSQSRGEVLPGFGFYLDSTLSIRHGWSGSPVIGDDGKVVGIVARCVGRYVSNTHHCHPNNAQFSILQ
jgi:S1-C subfamily serine protease